MFFWNSLAFSKIDFNSLYFFRAIVWHHSLDGREYKQALGVGDGQGSLACCSPWGHKESDVTE